MEKETKITRTKKQKKPKTSPQFESSRTNSLDFNTINIYLAVILYYGI